MVLRGRPRRRGTSSSPNLDAVCSTQATNLRLSESEGKRKKELTPFFPMSVVSCDEFVRFPDVQRNGLHAVCKLDDGEMRRQRRST